MKKITISIDKDINEFIISKKVHPRESTNDALRRLLKLKEVKK